ncbi:MAG: Hsp20/alpha crystallin family protein [Limisphaerales bacterium]|jgi:HSP20 family protein
MKQITVWNRGWSPLDDWNKLSLPWGPLTGWRASQTQGVSPSTETQWSPAIDICEEDNQFVLQAELPGIHPKAFSLKVEQGVMTLSGERKRPEVKEGRQEYRQERLHGNFSRQFKLPADTSPEGIKASFKDGLLTVEIPKRPKPQPQEIVVEVA